MSPVPIIAPPKDHAPKLPLSTETLAKVRLSRYLEREARGREMDGLPTGICKRPPAWMVRETIEDGWSYVDDEDTWEDDTMIEWEVILGIGRKRREAVVSWLLDVLPSRKPGHAPSTVSSPTTSSLSSTSLSPSSFSLSTFSSSTVSSQDTSDTRPHTCSNLQDQLQNSPETRFHAVWMFLRYFYLTMSPGLDSESRPSRASISRTSSIDSDRSSVQEEGLGLVVWDIAVACLSVSVKFHRDFLDPLLPVYAQEYLALAPHDLSHEDLESAHRDVLSAFDYRLGVTPQPVMDELWSSLSSLRNLLDFEGGWKYAMLDAWTRLFVVLDEPDVQRFLVSMLTVVALMDGVIESLVDEYCRDEVLKTRSISPAAERYLNLQTLRKKFNIRAREESEGVFCDIQALTGVTDVDLRECRVWMSRQLK
ncbi:hypothetical protein BDZ97DRAFT_351854 [Flammula alnicola]|nr:hypothetical protein BDZ97DRAFT_351854 [Flammula alnicola]